MGAFSISKAVLIDVNKDGYLDRVNVLAEIEHGLLGPHVERAAILKIDFGTGNAFERRPIQRIGDALRVGNTMFCRWSDEDEPFPLQVESIDIAVEPLNPVRGFLAALWRISGEPAGRRGT